jgi:3-dehydroquinate synthase
MPENSNPENVVVQLGDRSYAITVGHGILSEVGTAYKSAQLGGSAVIVTNPTVAEHYLDTVQQSLEAVDVRVSVATMPDGEVHKTFATAGRLHGDLIEAGADRTSCIVTLGGGVVGDTAGFVAATYMRGIDFIQIPTTLEAQVDASVGGKTGVDHPLGKNVIGAFHQPRLVYVDTDTLRSLPGRELSAGMAEVVKHGLIRDPELVDLLEDRIDDFVSLSADPDAIDDLIARNCRIKAAVVEADETEKGLREILNYGHTVGHALEAVTHYDVYRHGEAVRLGMLAAGEISRLKGLLSDEDATRHNALIARLGIPPGAEKLDEDAILERMAGDKKARGGTIRFVLLHGIGDGGSHDDVTREEMIEGIRFMQGLSR